MGCWWQRSIAELVVRCCQGVGVGVPNIELGGRAG